MNKTMTKSLLTRHGTPKSKLEAFGELILGNRQKWRSIAIQNGALVSEVDDVISESLMYLISKPDLELTERLMHVTVKCRAKNRRRARGSSPIGMIDDLMLSHQRKLIIDEMMSVDDEIELEEALQNGINDVRENLLPYYADLLVEVCNNPDMAVVNVGATMGILPNTTSGIMRKIKQYLRSREAHNE